MSFFSFDPSPTKQGFMMDQHNSVNSNACDTKSKSGGPFEGGDSVGASFSLNSSSVHGSFTGSSGNSVKTMRPSDTNSLEQPSTKKRIFEIPHVTPSKVNNNTEEFVKQTPRLPFAAPLVDENAHVRVRASSSVEEIIQKKEEGRPQSGAMHKTSPSTVNESNDMSTIFKKLIADQSDALNSYLPKFKEMEHKSEQMILTTQNLERRIDAYSEKLAETKQMYSSRLGKLTGFLKTDTKKES